MTRRKFLTLSDLQSLAAARGGFCLSNTYASWPEKIRWQCSEGHIWEAMFANIAQGRWCPTCYRLRRDLTLESLQNLAQARGGSCLSKKCIGAIQKHSWQCSEGHKWEATPTCISQGRWCPTCARIRRSSTLESLQHLARDRGGELLSKASLGALKHHLWKCSQGHIWEATPNHVKHGAWCPTCSTNLRRNSYLQEMASRQGGQYLRINSDGKCKAHYWSCSQGHVWAASPREIFAGRWCPECDQGKAGSVKDGDR